MTETGVWLIGARRNVATTARAGARALARGQTDTTGLVTALLGAEEHDLSRQFAMPDEYVSRYGREVIR